MALDDGRDWFAHHWGAVPAEAGLDTASILAAAADGRIDLVLLGADPLVDVPDADLACRGLEGAGSVISVDLFRTASNDTPTWCSPPRLRAEVDGTTTNIEGRVSRVTQQGDAPGTARADWMIAGRAGAAA